MLRRIFEIFQGKGGLRKGRQLYARLIDPEMLSKALDICALRDDFSGRFEALALCGALALEGQDARQDREEGFVGALVADIDTAFRENSLGDATVKKHAKNHAAALYGRLRAYGRMLSKPEEVEETLQRNLYGGEPEADQIAALPHVLPQLKDLLGDVYD